MSLTSTNTDASNGSQNAQRFALPEIPEWDAYEAEYRWTRAKRNALVLNSGSQLERELDSRNLDDLSPTSSERLPTSDMFGDDAEPARLNETSAEAYRFSLHASAGQLLNDPSGSGSSNSDKLLATILERDKTLHLRRVAPQLSVSMQMKFLQLENEHWQSSAGLSRRGLNGRELILLRLIETLGRSLSVWEIHSILKARNPFRNIASVRALLRMLALEGLIDRHERGPDGTDRECYRANWLKTYIKAVKLRASVTPVPLRRSPGSSELRTIDQEREELWLYRAQKILDAISKENDMRNRYLSTRHMVLPGSEGMDHPKRYQEIWEAVGPNRLDGEDSIYPQGDSSRLQSTKLQGDIDTLEASGYIESYTGGAHSSMEYHDVVYHLRSEADDTNKVGRELRDYVKQNVSCSEEDLCNAMQELGMGLRQFGIVLAANVLNGYISVKDMDWRRTRERYEFVTHFPCPNLMLEPGSTVPVAGCNCDHHHLGLCEATEDEEILERVVEEEFNPFAENLPFGGFDVHDDVDVAPENEGIADEDCQGEGSSDDEEPDEDEDFLDLDRNGIIDLEGFYDGEKGGSGESVPLSRASTSETVGQLAGESPGFGAEPNSADLEMHALAPPVVIGRRNGPRAANWTPGRMQRAGPFGIYGPMMSLMMLFSCLVLSSAGMQPLSAFACRETGVEATCYDVMSQGPDYQVHSSYYRKWERNGLSHPQDCFESSLYADDVDATICTSYVDGANVLYKCAVINFPPGVMAPASAWSTVLNNTEYFAPGILKRKTVIDSSPFPKGVEMAVNGGIGKRQFTIMDGILLSPLSVSMVCNKLTPQNETTLVLDTSDFFTSPPGWTYHAFAGTVPAVEQTHPFRRSSMEGFSMHVREITVTPPPRTTGFSVCDLGEVPDGDYTVGGGSQWVVTYAGKAVSGTNDPVTVTVNGTSKRMISLTTSEGGIQFTADVSDTRRRRTGEAMTLGAMAFASFSSLAYTMEEMERVQTDSVTKALDDINIALNYLSESSFINAMSNWGLAQAVQHPEDKACIYEEIDVQRGKYQICGISKSGHRLLPSGVIHDPTSGDIIAVLFEYGNCDADTTASGYWTSRFETNTTIRIAFGEVVAWNVEGTSNALISFVNTENPTREEFEDTNSQIVENQAYAELLAETVALHKAEANGNLSESAARIHEIRANITALSELLSGSAEIVDTNGNHITILASLTSGLLNNVTSLGQLHQTLSIKINATEALALRLDNQSQFADITISGLNGRVSQFEATANQLLTETATGRAAVSRVSADVERFSNQTEEMQNRIAQNTQDMMEAWGNITELEAKVELKSEENLVHIANEITEIEAKLGGLSSVLDGLAKDLGAAEKAIADAAETGFSGIFSGMFGGVTHIITIVCIVAIIAALIWVFCKIKN